MDIPLLLCAYYFSKNVNNDTKLFINRICVAGILHLTMVEEEKLKIDVEERLKTMNVDNSTATPNNQQINLEITDNLKQFMEEAMFVQSFTSF